MVDTQLSEVVFCMVLTFVVMSPTYLKSANYHSSLGANCYKVTRLCLESFMHM